MSEEYDPYNPWGSNKWHCSRDETLECEPLYTHPPAALPESAVLTALQRLADTADAVGVRHFDSDDLSPEVENMQEATQHARAVLAAARGVSK